MYWFASLQTTQSVCLTAVFHHSFHFAACLSSEPLTAYYSSVELQAPVSVQILSNFT